MVEHSFLAMALGGDSRTLVQVVKRSANGSVALSAGAPGGRLVRVARMERQTKVQLFEAAGGDIGLRKWLGVRGGTHVRMVCRVGVGQP